VSNEQQTQTIIAYVETSESCGRKFLHGYVLRTTGKWVELEQEQQGKLLEDWAISEIPSRSDCIMVWRGVCKNEWSAGLGSDWEPRLYGQWASPTADELMSLSEPQIQKEAQR
jgi:hypothetical protein